METDIENRMGSHVDLTGMELPEVNNNTELESEVVIFGSGTVCRLRSVNSERNTAVVYIPAEDSPSEEEIEMVLPLTSIKLLNT